MKPRLISRYLGREVLAQTVAVSMLRALGRSGESE